MLRAMDGSTPRIERSAHECSVCGIRPRDSFAPISRDTTLQILLRHVSTATLAGLPPIRVHVRDAEVLLDDSLRYVEHAVAAGVDARVDVWEGMPHGFIGSVGRLDASAQTLGAIGAFLSKQFAADLGN